MTSHPKEPKLPQSLEAMPELDTAHILPYSAIRYVAGYPESYVKAYARAYAESALKARDAEIERLRGELREREAHFFEVRKLLDERPAINSGLFEAYSKWTGKVYSLDWLNAIDQARATGGETKS